MKMDYDKASTFAAVLLNYWLVITIRMGLSSQVHPLDPVLRQGRLTFRVVNEWEKTFITVVVLQGVSCVAFDGSKMMPSMVLQRMNNFPGD